MKRPVSRSRAAPLSASQIVIRELETYLRETRVRHVHFSDGTTVPPALAYVTNFARLSIPPGGCHTTEISDSGRTRTIKPIRGHGAFVPDHAWTKPDWLGPMAHPTLLSGTTQRAARLA